MKIHFYIGIIRGEKKIGEIFIEIFKSVSSGNNGGGGGKWTVCNEDDKNGDT